MNLVKFQKGPKNWFKYRFAVTKAFSDSYYLKL